MMTSTIPQREKSQDLNRVKQHGDQGLVARVGVLTSCNLSLQLGPRSLLLSFSINLGSLRLLSFFFSSRPANVQHWQDDAGVKTVDLFETVPTCGERYCWRESWEKV